MNRRILAVMFALLLAVGGAALVLMYARNADDRAIAAESPTTVWVSQKVVPAGTVLKDAQRTELVAKTAVAAKALPEGALQSINSENSSLVALSDIQPGEILLSSRFGSMPVGTKAIEVPSGMLAVSVELTDPARVGKFVTPGSRIAIFQSYKIKDLSDSPQAKIINENDINGTSLLLGDVLVIGMGETPLAAPAQTQQQQSTQTTPSFLVTVAVSPKDATALIHGINNRKLYAGLRGSDVKIDPKLEVDDLTSSSSVSTP